MPRTVQFVRNFEPSSGKYQPNTDPSPFKNPFFRNWKFWVVIVALVIGVIASLKFDDVVEYTKSGKPRLKPDRIGKLEDTIRYYEGAEQYALIATESKYYLCLSCPNRDSIYLFKGETYKYGVTINGQSGRYQNGLPDPKLDYQIQCSGSLPRCQSAEQIKIINYPLLPENLKRKAHEKLARPPGNPYDN